MAYISVINHNPCTLLQVTMRMEWYIEQAYITCSFPIVIIVVAITSPALTELCDMFDDH